MAAKLKEGDKVLFVKGWEGMKDGLSFCKPMTANIKQVGVILNISTFPRLHQLNHANVRFLSPLNSTGYQDWYLPISVLKKVK